jgi:hypothetical protein
VFSGNDVPAGEACRYGAEFRGHHNWFNNRQGCERISDVDTVVSGDPGLLELADNGGFAQSRQPGADSPLIDAGDSTCSSSAGSDGLDVDRRGQPSPQGLACDVGAVELR